MFKRSEGSERMRSKARKHDRAWFERNVGELVKKIRRLPNERQLELFREMEKPEGSISDRREKTRESESASK
jgi:hypothetical protein